MTDNCYCPLLGTHKLAFYVCILYAGQHWWLYNFYRFHNKGYRPDEIWPLAGLWTLMIRQQTSAVVVQWCVNMSAQEIIHSFSWYSWSIFLSVKNLPKISRIDFEVCSRWFYLVGFVMICNSARLCKFTAFLWIWYYPDCEMYLCSSVMVEWSEWVWSHISLLSDQEVTEPQQYFTSVWGCWASLHLLLRPPTNVSYNVISLAHICRSLGFVEHLRKQKDF